MSSVSLKFEGGEKMKAALRQIAENAKAGPRGVRVGFLESATYPAGKKSSAPLHVAQVAFWNEFGTSRAPARPFFRLTIRRESPQWGDLLAKLLARYQLRSGPTFRAMGQLIKEQIQQSITQWPADNAASTVAKKGFNKGLIDTAGMLRSVDYELVNGP